MKDFRFEIQLADHAGNPIRKDGVLVDVVLFVGGRVRYQFNSGATNDCGSLEIDHARLDELRLSNQKFSLMDYNTPLSDCDSTIEVLIPSVTELEQRIEAARSLSIDESAIEKVAKSGNGEVVCESLKVDVAANAGKRLLLKCD
jgi:hypothetical protein